MSLDPSVLIVGFVVSGAGFVSFMYGKKQKRIPQVVAGLILMIYPYFVTNIALSLSIAVLLLALLWLATKAGY